MHRTAGVWGLTALVVGFAFLLIWFVGLALRELGLSDGTAMGVMAFTGILVQPRYSITRPMIFGAMLLSASIWLALRWWRLRDRSVLWFVPLVAVWLPIHPTASVGTFLVAGLVGAALISRAPRRDVLHAGLALAGCVALFALTPAGRGHIRTTLGVALGHAPMALALTIEWQRTRLGDPKLWIPLGLLLAALGSAAVERKGRLIPAGLALLGALLASRYLRNLYEALLLCAPLFGQLLQVTADYLRRKGFKLGASLLPVVLGLGLPGLYLRLVPAQAFNAAFGVGFDLGLFPQDTLATLEKLPAGRLIHDCTFGGYLIWKNIPVYCDGRTVALYDNRRVTELWLPLYLGERGLEVIGDRYDIRYGLARHDTDFERGMMKSTKWIPLHYDRSTSLFVREKYAAGIPLLGDLRFVDDDAWMKRWYEPVLADPVRRAALKAAVLRSFQLTADSPTLLQIVTFLKERDPALAAEIRSAL